MKQLSILTTIIILSISLAGAQGRMAPQNRGGNMRDRLIGALNLTDEQKKSFETLRFDMQKKAVEQQAQMKTARLELAELFKADQPSQSAIQKKIGDIAQLQSQHRILRVDNWFAVNKLLTPEQQKISKKASMRFLARQKARFIRGRAAQSRMRNQGSRRGFRQDSGAMGR